MRDKICAEVETLEREAPGRVVSGRACDLHLQTVDARDRQGGGIGGFLSGGRLFEKIGIHTSSANGKLTPEMAKTLPGDGVQLDYVSTSISLIMHPRSPRVPTVHMNTRYPVDRAGLVRRRRRSHADAAGAAQPGCAGRGRPFTPR